MSDFQRRTPPARNANPSDSSHPDAAEYSTRIPDTTHFDGTIALSIVSRSRLLREGLVPLIEPHLAVRLVGSYTGNTPPDDQMPNPYVHVVLIDCSIENEMVLVWTRWWRTRPTPAHVLLLEVEDDKDSILNYIEMGANGYTLKEAPPSDIARAIWLATQGLAQCSPAITAHLFERLAALNGSPALPGSAPLPLTSRELDVLHCLAQGMSNKEIAAALVIEVYTVKHHVHNILEKLKSRNRYEAVRLAAAHGWVVETARAPHSTLSI